MIEQDDWRLLNDVEHLKKAYINPTDGEEIGRHAPHLKHCVFCLDSVQDQLHQRWFVPLDLSCCICEVCFHDFKESFEWKKLDGWDMEWFIRCPRCGGVLQPFLSQDYVYECSECGTLFSEELNDD